MNKMTVKILNAVLEPKVFEGLTGLAEVLFHIFLHVAG